MSRWYRSIPPTTGRRLLVVLGLTFVTIAVGRILVHLTGAVPLSSVLLVSAFIGGPGVVILYGAYWLPDTDVRPEFYPTVLDWTLAGFGLMFAILGLYHVLAVGGISNPGRAIPILVSLSTAAGFAVGIHDGQARTRKRELEESNERLEQFAYAASHDLQEPLRMVSSYLRLLERQYGDELDEDAEEFIAYAVGGADRMRDMIDGLLAYSRVETQGEPFEPVDLDAVLDDVRDDMRVTIEEHDAEITVDPLPRVEGDAGQLRQLFQNLLENALEYSGDDPPRVHVAADRNGDECTISVRDEGIGIDPDDQERIFEVFQRLHSREEHPGSGIGLALCQRIAERHGSRIGVDSEPGEGSTFSVALSTAGDGNG